MLEVGVTRKGGILENCRTQESDIVEHASSHESGIPEIGEAREGGVLEVAGAPEGDANEVHGAGEGDVLKVEKLAGQAGDKVQFNDILMLGGETAVVGAPLVADAGVQAEILDQIRGPKVINYVKRRRKHSSQRKKGHRQEFTAVLIDGIKSKAQKSSETKDEPVAEAKKPETEKAAPKEKEVKKAVPDKEPLEKAETEATDVGSFELLYDESHAATKGGDKDKAGKAKSRRPSTAGLWK